MIYITAFLIGISTGMGLWTGTKIMENISKPTVPTVPSTKTEQTAENPVD